MATNRNEIMMKVSKRYLMSLKSLDIEDVRDTDAADLVPAQSYWVPSSRKMECVVALLTDQAGQSDTKRAAYVHVSVHSSRTCPDRYSVYISGDFVRDFADTSDQTLQKAKQWAVTTAHRLVQDVYFRKQRSLQEEERSRLVGTVFASLQRADKQLQEIETDIARLVQKGGDLREILLAKAESIVPKLQVRSDREGKGQ